MKVILQKDVKDLGKVGDVVNVAQGFARNLLFPKRMAVEATEKRIKQWGHLQKIAEIKKKKARSEREATLDKVNGTLLTIKAQASEEGALFGSISSHEIAKELEKKGHHIDKKDIEMTPIKQLGECQVLIKMDVFQAEIQVSIERA